MLKLNKFENIILSGLVRLKFDKVTVLICATKLRLHQIIFREIRKD